MIGRVLYGGGAIIATLEGVDDWTVTVNGRPNAAMASTLASYYRHSYHGPADGYYGQRILIDLADRMGGAMEIRKFGGENPDIVY